MHCKQQRLEGAIILLHIVKGPTRVLGIANPRGSRVRWCATGSEKIYLVSKPARQHVTSVAYELYVPFRSLENLHKKLIFC